MNDSSTSDRDPIDLLAEEFAERRRRGERPTVSEYIGKHPELADKIRQLFPALEIMEDLRPTADDEAIHSAAALGSHGAPRGLGDYRIEREIGRGGMGVVFEAQQESLGRRVALKVLLQGTFHNEKLVLRFRREALAAAKLQHTNIVPVFGMGEQDGVLYYVMQLINGVPLDAIVSEVKRLRAGGDASELTNGRDDSEAVSALDVARSLYDDERKLASNTHSLSAGPNHTSEVTQQESIRSPRSPSPISDSSDSRVYWRSVARIGQQAAAALQYAHNQGIFHRDIKPSNLLLDHRGTVWITDFGLAKTQNTDELTQSGDIVGTLRYMAPERFDGKCDARSDVYSLGLTLYELLALKPAFEASDRQELLRQVSLAETPRLATSISTDLRTIIEKCIEADPSLRYQSAAELEEDLVCFLEDRPIAARRISGSERIWRWCRRYPLASSLIAAISTLVFVTAIAASWAAVSFRQLARDELNARNDATHEANQRLDQLVHANVVTGARFVEKGNIPEAALYFAEAFRLDAGNAKNERFHRMRCGSALQACVKPVMLWNVGKRGRQIKLSNDGTLLVTFDDLESFNLDSGEACLWELATGKLVATLPHAKSVLDAAFSPDSRYIATASADLTARIWNARSGEPISPPLAHELTVRHVAFNHAGNRIVTATGLSPVDYRLPGKREAKVWSVPDGQDVCTLSQPSVPGEEWTNAVIDAAFSPDDQEIATVSMFQYARRWSAVTGESIGGLLDNGWSTVRSVRYSSDGNELIVSATMLNKEDPWQTWIWNLQTGEANGTPLRGELRGMMEESNQVLTQAGQDVLLWELNADQRTFVTFASASDGMVVRLSGSGRFILISAKERTAAPSAQLLDVRTRRLAYPPLFHTAPVVAAEFLADDRRVITLDADGWARVWDLATAVAPVHRIPITGFGFPQVTFSPSRRLVSVSDGAARYKPRTEIWNLETGTKIGNTIEHRRGLDGGRVFSPNEQFLVLLTGSRPGHEEAQLWNVASGTLHGTIQLPQDHEIDSIRGVWFSPDSRYLAIAGPGKRAQLWDVYTAQTVSPPLEHDSSVLHAAFSPDGGFLVTCGGVPNGNLRHGTDDVGEARLWQVPSGKPVGTKLAHEATVAWAEFSSDGKKIVTACRHRNPDLCTAQVWDVVSGRRISPPFRHKAAITQARFVAGDTRVATISTDGTALVWDIKTGNAITPPMFHVGVWEPTVEIRENLLLTGSQFWELETGLPASVPLETANLIFSADAKSRVGWDEGVIFLADETQAQHADDFISSAQLLTGRKLVQTGTTPLSAAEYERLWKSLLGHRPQELEASANQIGEWQLRQFRWHHDLAFILGEPSWRRIVMHADHALRIASADEGFPPDRIHDVLYHRGKALFNLDRFELAAEDFEKVLGASDDLAVFSEEYQAVWYFYLAQAYLGAGRKDDHRRICHQMRHRFDVTNNSGIYLLLAETSVCAAATFDNWSELLDAAQRHANTGSVRDIRVRAAISFRAGDYQEAIHMFAQLANLNSQTACDLAFLAMAYHNLGQTELAREKLIAARASSRANRPQRLFDHRWAHMETRLALDEATALIGEPIR